MYKSLLTSLIISGIALIFLCSCGKKPSPTPYIQGANPVYVVCEGSFGTGNAALTLYNSDSNTVVEDVYKLANGHSLGDVFQSMTQVTQDLYLLCINNSDKVIIMSHGSHLDMKLLPIPKPRYVLPINSTKAYVSTLFSNKIYIVNPSALSVTGYITMPRQNPEGMIFAGSKAYVCTWDTAATAIYPVDTTTNIVGEPVQVAGKAPQEIVQDKDGMLWILSGNKASGVESKLTRLNPATGNILGSYSFGTADPLRLVLNGAKDSLYFIEVSYTGNTANNGVYRMGIHDAALPTQAFIPAQGLQYFYGIGIHPRSGYIYVADPVGFIQRGKVYVYKPDGSLVNSFSTGVGPAQFVFE